VVKRTTKELADQKGITLAQLALAWVHSLGQDAIPIPGSSNIHHFDQNYSTWNIQVTKEEKAEFEEIFKLDAPSGEL